MKKIIKTKNNHTIKINIDIKIIILILLAIIQIVESKTIGYISVGNKEVPKNIIQYSFDIILNIIYFIVIFKMLDNRKKKEYIDMFITSRQRVNSHIFGFLKRYRAIILMIASLVFNYIESLYFGRGTTLGYNLTAQTKAETFCDFLVLVGQLFAVVFTIYDCFIVQHIKSNKDME